MEFDLVVRNGWLIDGSGAPRARGDVAVVADRIVEVGTVDGGAPVEIDATGLIVAPGFVDGHTHMDAQVFWDELGTSSCWHGVTTVVMGNCGFSLAPASRRDKAFVLRNLERAEDIPAEALEHGIEWSWSTFAEYLDAVDAQDKGINYVSALGHSALRTWAMGERAFSEEADDDDLALMKRELGAALRAGAAGFTTSRSDSHATSDDRPVASRLASWDEVVALAHVVGSTSTGAVELAAEPAAYSPDEGVSGEYFDRLRRLAVSTGVPVTFGVFAGGNAPAAMPVIAQTCAEGGEMYGLTHCRGISTLQSFETRLSFDDLPEWRSVRARPLDEQRRLLEDPTTRARLVHAAHHGHYAVAIGAEHGRPDFESLYVLYSVRGPNPTVAAESRRLGLDPVEAMIVLALQHDFRLFFQRWITSQPDDELVELLRDPNTAMTFSDAGAHGSQIIDASLQTHMLAHWVRERQMFTLEEAVRMMTVQPAKLWRLHDRGRLADGFAADIVVFDEATVDPLMPEVATDLPGGARRLVQRCDGIAATIVNGRVLLQDGEPTDARPGRLLRAGSIARPERSSSGARGQ